ncbi:unnamed protein product [Leptosia nina]|uniref:MADF domain-containing protein n=1 Tax=Leptosia nina TaxID=320188 RepID=A0AAV1J044_9NEOP
MPRRTCYWSRRLDFQLVEFIRKKDIIWKPVGNTNHHIQQKYKAYAEFASKLGREFTARSVRDRWANIRSTFNHNLRKVLKSEKMAKNQDEVYTPCWPLWKALQFLRDPTKSEESVLEEYSTLEGKPENFEADLDEPPINLRQRGQHIYSPQKYKSSKRKMKQCKEVLDNLIVTMSPLNVPSQGQNYWFFGRHVTERLNTMRLVDAKCARREILKLLKTNEGHIDQDNINDSLCS